MSRAFETICRQYLVRMDRAGRIDPPFDRIGKFYYDDPKTKTNGEFDIVTEDPNGYVFYEAKFRNTPISKSIIDAEIAQVGASGLDCYKYGFFSRSGFSTQRQSNMLFIELADLYK